MSGQSLPSLAGAEWLAKPQTQRVFAALTVAGHGARAVGGCVRNSLMGLAVTDIDIATTALPAETAAAAKAAGFAAIPTGIEHGTITVVADHLPYEVTTLRRDVATDGRRAVVAFTQDWSEDARRRDFTMNALYCAADGTVFDPLGGYGDLKARRVRFIGDPSERIREDYLRILRFFRFHATYGVGVLDADGARACVRLRDGLRQLSAERIGAEMMKLLVAPRAVEAVTEMFELGLLVDVLASAPRMPRFSRLVALERDCAATADAALRLKALAVHVTEDAARLTERLRLSSGQKAVLALAGPRLGTLTHVQDARGGLYRMGSADYRRHVLLQWAESGSFVDDEEWLALWNLPVSAPVPPFPLTGRDLLALGFAPGPKMGELLRELEAHWIASDFMAGADELIALARSRIS